MKKIEQEDIILTPSVLKKLDEVPLEVSLWNGNFNRCVVERTINRRHYRVEVNDAHPLVHQFVIQSVIDTPVTFWYNHCCAVGKPIPKELDPLIEKMKAACKMQGDQAKQVYADMLDCIRQFRRDFYGEDV